MQLPGSGVDGWGVCLILEVTQPTLQMQDFTD